MKTLALIWTVATLAAGTAIAKTNEAYRTFADSKGRSVRARIIDYDPEKAKLLVEREDHRRIWIDAASFSRNDQPYIQGWLNSYAALSAEALAINVDPTEGPWKNTGSREGKRRKASKYHCAVTVEKHTDTMIEDLCIEYRYVVAADEATAAVGKLHQYGGAFKIGSVTNGQTLTFNTETIELIDEYHMQLETGVFGSSYNEVEVRSDHLLGVWLKIHGSSPDGVPIVRDICIPEDLHQHVTWKNSATLLDHPADPDTHAPKLASRERR